MSRLLVGAITSFIAALAIAAPAHAAFGVKDFDGATVTQSGEPSVQAGAHPYSVTTRLDFNRTTDFRGESVPDGQPRDISVDLPVGFAGVPTATPTCSEAAYDQARCPVDSQVGFATILFENRYVGYPVFNMEPAPHQAAQFLFKVVTEKVHLDARVRSGTDYGVTIDVRNIPQGIPVVETELTFWGVPADPSHDAQRGPEAFCIGFTEPNQFCSGGGFPAGLPPAAFLRNPTSCAPQPLVTRLSMTGWLDLTAPAVTSSFEAHDNASPPNPVTQTGCGKVPFTPSINAEPTSVEADSPTGLLVTVRQPQEGLTNPVGIAQSDLRKTVVTLPEGMVVNPSSAGGLEACTNAQIGFEIGTGNFSDSPPACPAASRLGSVEIRTPLLDHPILGGVYLAKQGENKFGSLLATYLAAEDPQTGVVIKLPGRIAADAKSGRLVATFDETPQLPFEELSIEFFGGPRASLLNPPSCGSYQLSGEFTPWSGSAPVTSTSSFQVSRGPGGGQCPAGGFDPKLNAGTLNPLAGAHSPFVLEISREDGTQRLRTISARLPQGLLGSLKGIPYCPDSVLGSISDAEGSGQVQIGHPSCPAASQVGTVAVGAGAGSNPFYTQTGRAYLAGPYKGAPLSLAVVTPAVAGPFDLGTVVVRNALKIDPETAKITAVSDPIPTILHGVLLDIRNISVDLDRPGFILNPTSCKAMAVDATVSGDAGASAALSSRFQVSECGSLGFEPRLALELAGPTHRSAHPALKATLTMPKGGANVAKTVVTLPKTEFLENAHIQTICTRPQYAANQCPAKSIYGYAKAWTPLLDKPLQGPVYLRANGGARDLPDLVASLGGQIHVDLAGYIDSVDARIRTRFTTVPDAPVTKFELNMKGGKKGLLVNNAELCKTKPVADVKFTGQNGKVLETRPAVKVACGKGK
jgi:hypothetical protein